MNNGIKIMGFGILCAILGSYLDISGITPSDYGFILVIAGVIIGLVGIFKKETDE